jgi:hypothetical protein
MSYDPATKTITYGVEEEFVPGMKAKLRQLMRILDADHYTLEWTRSTMARKKRSLKSIARGSKATKMGNPG